MCQPICRLYFSLKTKIEVEDENYLYGIIS